MPVFLLVLSASFVFSSTLVLSFSPLVFSSFSLVFSSVLALSSWFFSPFPLLLFFFYVLMLVTLVNQ